MLLARRNCLREADAGCQPYLRYPSLQFVNTAFIIDDRMNELSRPLESIVSSASLTLSIHSAPSRTFPPHEGRSVVAGAGGGEENAKTLAHERTAVILLRHPQPQRASQGICGLIREHVARLRSDEVLFLANCVFPGGRGRDVCRWHRRRYRSSLRCGTSALQVVSCRGGPRRLFRAPDFLRGAYSCVGSLPDATGKGSEVHMRGTAPRIGEAARRPGLEPGLAHDVACSGSIALAGEGRARGRAESTVRCSCGRAGRGAAGRQRGAGGVRPVKVQAAAWGRKGSGLTCRLLTNRTRSTRQNSVVV